MRREPTRKKAHRKTGFKFSRSKSKIGRILTKGSAEIWSGRPTTFAAKAGRIGAIVLASFVLLVSCYMVVAKVSKPYLISYRESKDIIDIKRQITEAKDENRSLKDQIEYLKTDRGKVAEARKLGFVKSGEISLVVGKQDRTPDFDSSDAKPAQQSVWSSVKHKASSLFQHTHSAK